VPPGQVEHEGVGQLVFLGGEQPDNPGVIRNSVALGPKIWPVSSTSTGTWTPWTAMSVFRVEYSSPDSGGNNWYGSGRVGIGSACWVVARCGTRGEASEVATSRR